MVERNIKKEKCSIVKRVTNSRKNKTKWYTKLYYEKENERLYLSTINGHLEVYLISNSTPLFVKDIITNTSENYSLNDLIPYKNKHYLFSSI